jgi:hypothetical protein
MARNSRLSVCFETLISYSSQIHWHKSMIRRRTTPCTAGIGPFCTIIASAARCSSFSSDGWPGALRSISPFGTVPVEPQRPVPYQPNGFSFLEPSVVSAFLASPSVLEIAYFRRRWRAALMVAATFISMGVTGISMLVIAVPFLLLREKRQVRRPSFSSSGSRLLRSISACRLSRG